MNKKIFERMFNIINDNQINDDSIISLINKLQELDERYLVEIQNRLELLNEIKSSITLLQKKTTILNNELIKLEQLYAYRDTHINNYDKVMELILNLANKEDNRYELKTIYAEKSLNSNTDSLYCKTLIITDNRLTPSIDKQIYKCNEIYSIIKAFIESHYSIVVITQNVCNGDVKPKESLFNDITYEHIKNSGLAGDISCYLYDDELKIAIDKLIEYIKEYGADFTNIELDKLTELVSNYNNHKTYIK